MVTLCCFPKIYIFQFVIYEQLIVSHNYIKTGKGFYTFNCDCF